MNLKLIKLKGEIDKFTIIVDFYISHLLIEYTKTNKDMDDMNNTMKSICCN